MKNKYLLIVFATLMIGGLLLSCDKNEKARNDTNTRMVYTKDVRTGLCFAVYNNTGYKYGLAEVPCEKVEAYIVGNNN